MTHSGSVLDRDRAVPDEADVRTLLVLWQHPESRQIIPIGRFCHDEDGFTFVYSRAAAAITDFRPLPGLADLHAQYVGPGIPAVFGQRVMDRDRPDFHAYAQVLGLDPIDATPWEQIVRSGGNRAGDTLQFMPLPEVIDGRATARFLVNGIRHICDEAHKVSGRITKVIQDRQEAALGGLRPGSTVLLEAEEDNLQDANACLVTAGGVPVGWVPRALSASVRELLAHGPLPATVVRVAGPTVPPHIRLVLDMDAPAPDGFTFDREGLWEPLTRQ